jgi:NAD+ diphosphatase
MRQYPTAVNLPFNFAAIKDGFTPLRPGEAVADGPGFWVILQGNNLVVRDHEGQKQLPVGPLPAWVPAGREPLTVGLWQGEPLRVVSLARDLVLPPPFSGEAFNASGDTLDDVLLTLGGMAKQLLHWDRQSRHCSQCGGALLPIAGSWGKRCPD